MKERILLINVHSSKNIGDAALLAVTLQQLNDNFPGSLIQICLDDPESHRGMESTLNSVQAWVHPYKSDGTSGWKLGRLAWLLPATVFPLLSQKLLRRRMWILTPNVLRKTIEAYLEADFVVSKPGGFLYSSGRGIILLVAIFSILFACWAGKPVYIYPQSIGPFNHKWEPILIRKLLERVRITMLRETVSFQLIKNLGLRNPRLYLVPDSAFCLTDAGADAGKTWLEQHGVFPDSGTPLLGMTLINWGAQNKSFGFQADYEAACATAIRFFVETIKGRVIIFPQVYGPLDSQDDRIPAHRVMDQLGYPGGMVTVIDQPIEAQLLKSVYGWMDVFIGSRMHSNIFALSKGIPTIAIGYLHKTRGICQMVGVNEWVIDIHMMKGSILQEKLSELWTVRQIWKLRIQERLPSLIFEAETPGKMIAEDYFGSWKSDKHG